jgi:hypothetical protein
LKEELEKSGYNIFELKMPKLGLKTQGDPRKNKK